MERMSLPQKNAEPKNFRDGPGIDWPMAVVVWCCCLTYSFLRAPLPGVNEPHYLSMARSFVEPGWCDRDPFLQSHPVHWVFFTLLGWPTYWWGFEAAAVFGRLIGYGTVAIGWVALLGQLRISRLASLGILLGTLIAMSIGNFSGEWLIGGIEGKVFSYGAVFGSLAALMAGDAARTALWSGVALAFHPVIGAWHVIAVLGTLVLTRLSRNPIFHQTSPLLASGKRNLFWGIALVFGLVGFLPAFSLLMNVSPDIAFRGTQIQVYDRLAHHLNPLTFPLKAYVCYGALLAAYVFMLRIVPNTRAWRICQIYVGWCIAFALGGIFVGYVPQWLPGSGFDRLSPRLLKFYPFRMADLLLPWFVIAGMWNLLTEGQSPAGRRFLQLTLVVVLLGGLSFWMARHPVAARPPHLSAQEAADWIDACDWLRNRTPTDALCLTSRKGWAFKWYAQRAEYFSHKDAPQDAAGLIAWEDRQKLLWELFSVEFSKKNLEIFRGRTKTDFALLGRNTPCDLKPVYENPNFCVYDLRQLDADAEQ